MERVVNARKIKEDEVEEFFERERMNRVPRYPKRAAKASDV